jgi:peptide deformylase
MVGRSDDDGVLPIVLCGDPVLRQPAMDVARAELGSPGLARLVARMRATMEAAPGVGLAAPQIGLGLRLAVAYDGPEYWEHIPAADLASRERSPLPFTVMVNPVLTPLEDDGYASFYEGCLSVPGLTAVVRRYRSVRVDALDERGEPFARVLTGWPARIAQHELDHLAGVLYLDRAETRSLSTVDTYARRWAGPPAVAAEALGFNL